MTELTDTLTPEEYFIYKWKLNKLGGFKTDLMRAITHADQDNLDRLELGFPVEVGGYRNFAYEPGWWQKVERKVEEWRASK